MAKLKQNIYQPDKDTGWGLIFRLNGLWEKVDRKAEVGDYEGWEIVLDRIFSNLMYRTEATIVEDDDENVTDVEINDKEYEVFMKVKEKISKVKGDIFKARRTRNIGDWQKAKLNYYRVVMFYDIWLRKFMQSRGLYLKEVEHNPSKALFGGRF